MSTTLLLIGCGMLVGLGVFVTVLALAPRHPSLAAIRPNLIPAQLTGARPYAPTRRVPLRASTVPASGADRLGAAISARLAGTPLKAPQADLSILGISEARFYGEKGAAMLAGFLIPMVLPMLSLAGIPIPFIVPAILSMVLAVLFWFIPDLSVRSRAERARTDYAYGAVSYLRLVAIQRLGSSALISSMEDSSRISDEWMFTRIRQELTLARYSKVAPWEALSNLADEIGVEELRKIGEVTRLAGDAGAAVTGSLMAQASSLRDKLLTQEQKEAAAATTAIAAPLVMLLGISVAAVGYPAVITLLST